MFRRKNKAKQFENAIICDDMFTISRLVMKGFPIDSPLYEDKSPLMIAANAHRAGVARYLLVRGADVAQVTDDGMTALHMACLSGQNVGDNSRFADTVQALLDFGADVNATNDYSESPLHLVCQKAGGYSLSVDVLVKAGADIDVQDEDGRTPLHVAVDNSNFPLVKQLFDKGSDLNIKDFHQASLLDIAMDHQHFEIALYLIEHGAEVKDNKKLKLYEAICKDNQSTPFSTELGGLCLLMQMANSAKQNEFKNGKSMNEFQNRLQAIEVTAIPLKYCSPGTRTVMHEPITLSNGLTYDRMQLINYFAQLNFPKTVKVPLVETPIKRHELYRAVNHCKRQEIERFIRRKEKAYLSRQFKNRSYGHQFGIFAATTMADDVKSAQLQPLRRTRSI